MNGGLSKIRLVLKGFILVVSTVDALHPLGDLNTSDALHPLGDLNTSDALHPLDDLDSSDALHPLYALRVCIL